MTMSPTSAVTMAPKAAPMITPTARSTTLPRSANFLKSSSMGRLPTWLPPQARMLIDQPGMHHGLAHGGLGLLAGRHHRQPHRIGALADQRHRILDRRRTGFDEQVDVQRRELVLQPERGLEIALQAGALEFGAQSRRHVRRHRNTAMTAMRHEAERCDVLAGKLVEILADAGALLRHPRHIGGGVLDAGDVL